jgi:hypothetical protein
LDVKPVTEGVYHGNGERFLPRKRDTPARSLAHDLSDHRECLGTLVAKSNRVMIGTGFVGKKGNRGASCGKASIEGLAGKIFLVLAVFAVGDRVQACAKNRWEIRGL